MTGDRPESYECFEHGRFILEFLRFGTGPRPVLAFHGFGRRAEDFAFFSPHLASDISLYSFNLFGHGRSRYPDERIERDTIGKEEFAGIFTAFLNSIGAEKAGLLAYSLGGKLAMTLMEKIPERIESAYLFAPDGLSHFHPYRWTSRLPFAQRIFRYTVRHPFPLFFTFNALKTFRIISSQAKTFLKEQARYEEQRRAVHEIWNIHRDLGPKLSLVRRNIQQHDIEVRMIFGARDPVIPVKKVWKLLDPEREKWKVHVLDQGHLLLNNRTLSYLKDSEQFEDRSGIFF